VEDEAPDDAVDLRSPKEVVVECLELHLFALIPADDFVGAGADVLTGPVGVSQELLGVEGPIQRLDYVARLRNQPAAHDGVRPIEWLAPVKNEGPVVRGID